MATKTDVLSTNSDGFEEAEIQQKEQEQRPQKPKKKRRYAIIDDFEEPDKRRKQKHPSDNPFESNDEFGHPIPDLYPELYETVEDVEISPSPEEKNDSHMRGMDSQPIGVKKKRKVQSGKKGKNVIEEDSEDEGAKQRVGSWVQCCRPECAKWRCLNVTIDSHDVEDKWVCAMNPDINFNTCVASQEDFDSQDSEYDVIYTSFPEGSVIWAKIAGYPWWPGMMEDDPDYGYYCETDEENSRIPTSYHIVFFDKDVSRAWISHYNVRPFKYNDTAEQQGNVVFRGKSYKKKLDQAIDQAREALVLPPHERLKVYGFAQRYGGKIGRQRKTPKEKKPKEQKKEDIIEENIEDSPNSLDIFMELSEEFQASESSENISQEIQKPTKKKGASKKTKEKPKPVNKEFLAVKSTKGNSKAPKKSPSVKAKTKPAKAKEDTGGKTPKGNKKSADGKQEGSKDASFGQDDEKQEVALSPSVSTSSKIVTVSDAGASEDKTLIQNIKDLNTNKETTVQKEQTINPKKRKLKQYKEEQASLKKKANNSKQPETKVSKSKKNTTAGEPKKNFENATVLADNKDEIDEEKTEDLQSKTKKKPDSGEHTKNSETQSTDKKGSCKVQHEAHKAKKPQEEQKNSTETSETTPSDEKTNKKQPRAKQTKPRKKPSSDAEKKNPETKTIAEGPPLDEKTIEVDKEKQVAKKPTPKKKPPLIKPNQKQDSTVAVSTTCDKKMENEEKLKEVKASKPFKKPSSVKPNKKKEDDQIVEKKKDNKVILPETTKEITIPEEENNNSKNTKTSSSQHETNNTQSSQYLSPNPQVQTKPVHVQTPMPKLIKPAFKPPSKNSANNPPKAKKMPKLTKAQFVQPGLIKDKMKGDKKGSKDKSETITQCKVVPNEDAAQLDEKAATGRDMTTDPALADEVEVELAKLDKDIENMKKTIKLNDVALDKLRCGEDSPEF